MQKELPVRKNIRLQGYDYSSAGYYFITICVKNMHQMLGKVVGHDDPACRPYIELSEYGIISDKHIQTIEPHYNGVFVDKYCIMPNHIHIIFAVCERESGAPGSSRPTTALIPRIIAAYKKYTNKELGFDMWQARFYDRIIRDEEAYRIICQYIDNNPAKWTEDDYFVKK
jgi:REP element-mobilizing transposase RayT